MTHLNHLFATALLAALMGCGVSASGSIGPVASAAPTAAPSATATATASPVPSATPTMIVDPSPDACAAEFGEFNVTRDLRLSYQEYEDGKWKQLRFIKAPTAAEEAAQRKAFRDEAIAADVDKDQHLSLEEFRALCAK